MTNEKEIKLKKTIVINLFGGPGVRKSTVAGGVCSLLKMHGVNCEHIPEFAKDLTWEQRNKSLKNQIYIFAKQYQRLWRVKGLVDVAITDSPLLFSLVYENDIKSEYFKHVVKEVFESFNNINYLLNRSGKYESSGRYQSESEAIEVDKKITDMLTVSKISYQELIGNYKTINYIVTKTLIELNIQQKYFITTLK